MPIFLASRKGHVRNGIMTENTIILEYLMNGEFMNVFMRRKTLCINAYRGKDFLYNHNMYCQGNLSSSLEVARAAADTASVYLVSLVLHNVVVIDTRQADSRSYIRISMLTSDIYPCRMSYILKELSLRDKQYEYFKDMDTSADGCLTNDQICRRVFDENKRLPFWKRYDAVIITDIVNEEGCRGRNNVTDHHSAEIMLINTRCIKKKQNIIMMEKYPDNIPINYDDIITFSKNHRIKNKDLT